MNEGQQVTYVGDDPVIGVGSRGRILSMAAGGSAHTQWATGSRLGEVDLVFVDDLLPYRAGSTYAEDTASQIDQSFQVPLVSSGIREAMDEQGEDGVLTMLDEAGHLAVLAEYADEAYGYVKTRIKQDPGLNQVLAQLDDVEAQALVSKIASILMADLVTEEGSDG